MSDRVRATFKIATPRPCHLEAQAMIHNHGPESDPACRETRRLDGTLRGSCLPREKWTLVGRETVNGKDWYVWDSQDRPERWVCPVRELIGETVTHGQA